MDDPGFETGLSRYDAESVEFAGLDLSSEVMGELSVGGTLYLLVTGERPTEGETRVLDAMLVSLVAHGTTPHAIAARMTLLSAPESVQGAVASGILGAGSRFLGAMERCVEQLERVTEGEVADAEALVAEFSERGDAFPGLGHPFHRPVDPRAERLFELAESEGVAGEHVALIREVRDSLSAEIGSNLPINVTGAIAAVSADMGLSPEVAKGIAIVSRTAGLVAEVAEERRDPQAMEMWQLLEEHTAYRPPAGDERTE